MLDFSHIPDQLTYDRQVFIGNMKTAAGLTQTWVKPRGISMVYIFMLGQGGNGAAGAVATPLSGGAPL